MVIAAIAIITLFGRNIKGVFADSANAVSGSAATSQRTAGGAATSTAKGMGTFDNASQ